MREIGAFEAKNRFGQLLDWVEAGEAVAITRRGKIVAHLTPLGDAFNAEAARAAAERIWSAVAASPSAAQPSAT